MTDMTAPYHRKGTSMRHKKNAAISLIELTVAIAVVALAAPAITLPRFHASA